MPEVINDILGYDGLKIIQDKDKFNFSLDSTLLANFVDIKKGDVKILDIGTGNGFIPLFLSLKTKSQIIGIDIQPELVVLAKRSVELNNLISQIHIYNEDAKEYYKKVGVSSFDVIVSNPPYFPYIESSRTNRTDFLTIARHEVNLTIDELVDSVKKLLKDNGTFYLVHRTERLIDIIEALRKNNFELKTLQFVFSKKSSTESQLVLIKCKKTKRKGGLKILQPLYVHKENGEYTDEVLRIFRFRGEE